MEVGNDKISRILDFSTEDEAFEWYETHEVTDHMDDTEEVDQNTIFYQNAEGIWYRASDGMQVILPEQQTYAFQSPYENEQVRIIYASLNSKIYIIYDDEKLQDEELLINTEIGSNYTWTSSSPLYATMQK